MGWVRAALVVGSLHLHCTSICSTSAHSTDDPPSPTGRWVPGLVVPSPLDPRIRTSLPPGCAGSDGGDCAAAAGGRNAAIVSVIGSCTYCFGVGASDDGERVFAPAYNEYRVWQMNPSPTSATGMIGARALPLLSQWYSFGGIYSVAWGRVPGVDGGTHTALYLANDGTCVPGDCTMGGVVRQILFAAPIAARRLELEIASERIILRNLTAPRQMVVDTQGRLYLVQEGGVGPAVLRWDPTDGSSTEVVARSEAATPQGVAVAPDGDVFFSEYGTMEAPVEDPSGHGSMAGVASTPGRVKVKRAANGLVSVVASGLWRCRGIALDAVRGQLYISNEANAWDQGSSGSIHRWNWGTNTLELILVSDPPPSSSPPPSPTAAVRRMPLRITINAAESDAPSSLSTKS
jgi:hypothetical protein